MRKVASSLLILILVAGVTADADPGKKKRDRHASNVRTRIERSKEGFRGLPWGSSVAHTKFLEKAEFVDEDRDGPMRVLMYKDSLNNIPVHVQYMFFEDKLIRAQYAVIADPSNALIRIVNFHELERRLRKKYRKPKESESTFAHDRYGNDAMSRGRALLAGHLSEYRYWERRNTTISLVLSGGSLEAQLIIDYHGKKVEKLANEKWRAYQERRADQERKAAQARKAAKERRAKTFDEL